MDLKKCPSGIWSWGNIYKNPKVCEKGTIHDVRGIVKCLNADQRLILVYGQTKSISTPVKSIGGTSVKIKKTQYGKHQQDCYYDPTGIAPTIAPGTHGSCPHLLKILLTKGANSMKETSPKSTQMTFPTTTSCAEDSPVRRLVSLVKDLDLMTQEALCSLKSQGFLKRKDQNIFYLKMLKDCFLTTTEELSKPSCPRLMNWGMTFNGKCLTARISESHRIGKECSLSDILEDTVEDKYFLSQEATQKVLSSMKL